MLVQFFNQMGMKKNVFVAQAILKYVHWKPS